MATFHTFQKDKPMIGLSLSFCIMDMINENLGVHDIVKIVSNTKAENLLAFENVLRSYTDVYWADFPEKAKNLARRLWAAGKIDQPRTRDESPHTISEGRWAEFDTDIVPH